MVIWKMEDAACSRLGSRQLQLEARCNPVPKVICHQFSTKARLECEAESRLPMQRESDQQNQLCS